MKRALGAADWRVQGPVSLADATSLFQLGLRRFALLLRLRSLCITQVAAHKEGLLHNLLRRAIIRPGLCQCFSGRNHGFVRCLSPVFPIGSFHADSPFGH